MSENEKPPQTTEYTELSHEFVDRFKGKEVTFSFRFRRPGVQQVSRAQKDMLKNSARAFSNLLKETVHPEDKPYLDDSLKDYPGLAPTFGNVLLISVGFGELGN